MCSHIILWKFKGFLIYNCIYYSHIAETFWKATKWKTGKGERNFKTSLKKLKDWEFHDFCSRSYHHWSLNLSVLRIRVLLLHFTDPLPHLRILIARLNDAQENLNTRIVQNSNRTTAPGGRSANSSVFNHEVLWSASCMWQEALEWELPLHKASASTAL